MAEQGQITQLLVKCKDGKDDALAELVSLMYGEIYEIAQHHMQNEFRSDHTLGATALVNEAYLKLVKQKKLDINQRSEFLAVASRTMRNVLVDYARARKREKRGGGQKPIPFEKVEHLLTLKEANEVLALDELLDQLSAINERAALIVQYRFYGGLSLEDTADLLGVSVKTVQRSWNTARAWLRNKVSKELLD